MSNRSARFSKTKIRGQHRSLPLERRGAVFSAASIAIEALESRQLLSGSPVLTATGAPTAIEGQDYVLNLTAPAGITLQSWTINWGDGTIAAPDLQTVPGATTSLLHKYVDSPTAYHVTATATDGFSVFTANAGGGVSAGAPDLNFANAGKLVLSAPVATAVAVQADGKILVTNSGAGGFILSRYNVDGTLDDGSAADSTPLDSFGTAGKVTNVRFADNTLALMNSIAIQPDGKIVVGGSSFIFAQSFIAVVRFNTDGSLDTTFGPNADGKFSLQNLTDPTILGRASVTSVVIDNNAGVNFGKILLGGATGPIVPNSVASRSTFVGRLNANGTPDTTFGPPNAGNSLSGFTTYGGSVSDTAGGIALQSDDKIVSAGKIGDHGTVVRFNSDGSVDTGFGNSGEYRGTSGPLSGVAVEANGNIVAEGWINDPFNNQQWTVIRLSPTGTLTRTFDPVLPAYNRFDSSSPVAIPTSIALQADGKILATGTSDSNGSSGDFATVRYNVDGTADTTFGNGGAVVTDFGSIVDNANAIAVSPTGRIIIAGGTTFTSGQPGFILQAFGFTASATPVTVSVTDVAPVITLINVPANSLEGVTVSASANIVDFTPANLTNTWAVTKNGAAFTAGTGTAITFTPNDNGTYVLTFTSNDIGGASATASSTINVTNVAPTASVTADAIGAIGVRGQNRHIHIPVAADPSSVDTAAGFAYNINWGDGTTTAIAQTALASDPGHIYQYDGNYTVSVTATDKDNAISTAATLNLAITPIAIEGSILAIGGLTAYDLLIITQSNSGGMKTIRVIDDFLLKYKLSESLFTQINIYQATDYGTFVASNVTDAVYLVDANGTIVETIHAANPGH